MWPTAGAGAAVMHWLLLGTGTAKTISLIPLPFCCDVNTLSNHNVDILECKSPPIFVQPGREKPV